MITGLLMAVTGLYAVWLGGPVYVGMIFLIAGILIWELAVMLGASLMRSAGLGAGMIACLYAAHILPPAYALPILFLPAFLGLVLLQERREKYMPFALLISFAAYGLLAHRETFGFVWMTWLVLVVVVTDIAGYLIGRVVGGPKFWPRVSPKKTWSGTIAGWIGAGCVGVAYMTQTEAGAGIIAISVALAFASQMGDLAESAIKRHVGVKDSSRLLPGHGGVFDRFDGMIGAAALLLLVESLTSFPPQ
ncbi:phosphatidate cytidylyltransferase [Rhodobacterales bacterium HKCCA1065]|nr:phosphatidate cytidylyltransferase [Rhodobacterales bacterium HKCCA1065]